MEKILAMLGFILALLTSCGRHAPTGDWDGCAEDSVFMACYDLIYDKPDSIIKVASSKVTGDSLLHYRYNNLLSRALFAKGEVACAIEVNDRSLDYCRRHDGMTGDGGTSVVLAEALNNKGVYLTALGRHDEATAILQESCRLQGRNGMTEAQVNTLINLADSHYSRGKFNEASTYYRRALLLTDSLGLEKLYLPIYSGLGKLYLDIGNYTMSDRYFTDAEKWLEGGTTYEKFYYCTARGNYYYYINDYRSALGWFYKAYHLISDGIGRLTSACNIGETYIYLGEVDSAERYIDEAARLDTRIGGKPSSYYVRGVQSYLALLRGDRGKAREILHQLRHDYDGVSPEYAYLLNKRLYQYYEAQKDYRRAFRYIKEVNRYDDSLRNVKTLNNLAEASLRYRNDTTIMAKNKKLEESREEINKLTFMTTVSVLSFAIAVLLFSYITLLRKKRLERDRKETAAIINDYKLKVIKNRVTPHFIFNVLNAVMPSFRSHDELQAPIRSMVRLLRSGLTATDSVTVRLAREMEYVNDFITLFTISKGIDVETTWDIDPSINADEQIIPSMFIQLPVENALKYAYDGIDNPRLTITVRKSDGLAISIEDNGIGIGNARRDEPKENGAGVGLNAMNEILRLLNRNKAKRITMEITTPDDGQGTKILIFIPNDFKYLL